MNPCPCGFAGHPRRVCRCTPQAVQQYAAPALGPAARPHRSHAPICPAVPLAALTVRRQRRRRRPRGSASAWPRRAPARRARYAGRDRRHPDQRRARAGATSAGTRALTPVGPAAGRAGRRPSGPVGPGPRSGRCASPAPSPTWTSREGVDGRTCRAKRCNSADPDGLAGANCTKVPKLRIVTLETRRHVARAVHFLACSRATRMVKSRGLLSPPLLHRGRRPVHGSRPPVQPEPAACPRDGARPLHPAGPDRPGRALERVGGARPPARRHRRAAAGKRQLPRGDRRAHRADRPAPGRHRRAQRGRSARPRDAHRALDPARRWSATRPRAGRSRSRRAPSSPRRRARPKTPSVCCAACSARSSGT